MLDTAALTDIRGYIKRRVSYARYRVGSTYYRAELTDIDYVGGNTVRARLSIIPSGTVTVNRVELYSSAGELWAHQDCNITVSSGETGILFWFDFTITEKEA
ncbi:MAG: hypothetical protein IJT18_01700 [Oscillospiraceae bacterium]|nr:hypothetical protein [Oscillospiraceae bacterium]